MTFKIFLKDLLRPPGRVDIAGGADTRDNVPMIGLSGEGRMAGYLTTHVLDTARGCPASGLEIELYRIDGERRTRLRALTTNADGRTDNPILPEDVFETGIFELVFHAGPYLERTSGALDRDEEGASRQFHFLDVIPIRFGMAEATHYHVPLLLSPFGYSTYRGS